MRGEPCLCIFEYKRERCHLILREPWLQFSSCLCISLLLFSDTTFLFEPVVPLFADGNCFMLAGSQSIGRCRISSKWSACAILHISKMISWVSLKIPIPCLLLFGTHQLVLCTYGSVSVLFCLFICFVLFRFHINEIIWYLFFSDLFHLA